MSKGVIPWLGGKSLLASQIIRNIENKPHQCYVEVFAGGAHVFFRKEPSKLEVLNDINGDIFNLYRVLQNHLEEFIRQFKWMLTSREEFERLGRIDPSTLTDIQQAARFYYRQRLCFGGKISGQNFGTSTTSKPKLNLLRIEEELSQAHLRLHQVIIEHLDWVKILERYDRPHTLFYLDPPYYGCENDYGKGIFERENFSKMAALLEGLQGDFILSINDTPEIRKIFAKYKLTEVRTRYSISNGASTPVGELLIQRP